MEKDIRQPREAGFEIGYTYPSRLIMLFWNKLYAGYWTDSKSGLTVSDPFWNESQASPTAPQRANPAWVMRGMTVDTVKDLIKDYKEEKNV